MIYFKNLATVLFVAVVCFFVNVETSFATRPPTPPYTTVWGDSLDGIRAIRLDDLPYFPKRDLDNYIGQFERTCDFLDSMQEHNEDDRNFGGLHEGEGNNLWRIVETDNTQEAIRVWCEYAAFFDDPDIYRENIDAAWDYCDNFPAWEESEPGEMYGLHNSGWGLIAEMAFRTVYNDSHREYGLSCADHLVEYTPDIDPNMEDNLMPLVAGWVAGTLYEYGIFDDNEEYCDAALRIGLDVKEWIDADPNRLHANEIWALCGGTAIWGVIQSLGRDDSAETADWAIEQLEEMDVFAGNGRWNNSWNIWYANAWLAAWRLIGDDDYHSYVIAIVDSLVAQDGDGDGGIPATAGNPDNRDESWVSCYTAWMGLRQLFDALHPVNASVVRLIDPSTERPWPIESPLGFTFHLLNAGRLARVDVPFHLRGPIDMDTIVTIEGWQPNRVVLPEWTPDQTGDFEFTAYTNHEDDSDRSDDTLYFTLSTLSIGILDISASGVNDIPIQCQLDFYNLDIDSTVLFASITTDPDNGCAEGTLMIGSYRIEIIPDFPYARRSIEQFDVEANGLNRIDLIFNHPPILLVDRDIDSSHVDYYQNSLIATGYPFYHWLSQEMGSLEGRTDGFSAIIYFTGDRVTETITEEDQNVLIHFLNSGNCLFITGQNIADDLWDNPFLEDILHSRRIEDDVRARVVDGMEDDELLGGMTMLLLGNRGANNQDSPAGILPTEGGTACAVYRNIDDMNAVVRWDAGESKGVFFAFGFEGISGQLGNSRDEVMAAVLEWFEIPQEVTPDNTPLLLPSIVECFAYPNPTNGVVTIRFHSSSPTPWNAVIFDITGRKIKTLTRCIGSNTVWDLLNYSGIPVSSGMYYIMFQQNDNFITTDPLKIVLIR